MMLKSNALQGAGYDDDDNDNDDDDDQCSLVILIVLRMLTLCTLQIKYIKKTLKLNGFMFSVSI